MSGLEARFEVVRSNGARVGADLAIPRGRTSALLGPNGAGKTTVVDAIAGLVRIDAGSIVIDDRVLDDGRDVFVAPEARRLGIVFQDLLLFDHLDVAGNVAFGLRSRNVGREESAARAREWLERLGIDGLAAQRPAGLSGGQAQLVALARALASDPTMLLLDEPLSALDVAARVALRRTLGEHLGGFAGPRLLITHDPTEAFLLADEIHIIERGVITQTGTPEEIRMHPRTAYAADLAGVNLVSGVARSGIVDTGSHSLQIADRDIAGSVLLTIHPAAVAVHVERPGGSPRNAWPTTVERVEPLGSRVRLLTGPPLPLTVEVTDASRSDLGIEPGAAVWVAIKATEIRIQAAADGD